MRRSPIARRLEAEANERKRRQAIAHCFAGACNIGDKVLPALLVQQDAKARMAPIDRAPTKEDRDRLRTAAEYMELINERHMRGQWIDIPREQAYIRMTFGVETAYIGRTSAEN